MANILISENRQLTEQLKIAHSTQANLICTLIEEIEAKENIIELLQIQNQQKCNENLELQQERDDLQDANQELQQEVDSLKDENLELRQRVDFFSPDCLSIEDSWDEEY
jgi:predicted RNase H-like nuclease (RuvC/YqgF family)